MKINPADLLTYLAAFNAARNTCSPNLLGELSPFLKGSHDQQESTVKATQYACGYLVGFLNR